MIEWIQFGIMGASLIATIAACVLWRKAEGREDEALYLRDKWRDTAEGAHQVNKLLDAQYITAIDERNAARQTVRRQRVELARLRTDNQVLENTVISKNNEIHDVKVLHRDIERDLGKRIKELEGQRNCFMAHLGFATYIEPIYRATIRHLSGQLDKAKANDLRDAKGRFVSRRPMRGTGQRT